MTPKQRQKANAKKEKIEAEHAKVEAAQSVIDADHSKSKAAEAKSEHLMSRMEEEQGISHTNVKFKCRKYLSSEHLLFNHVYPFDEWP